MAKHIPLDLMINLVERYGVGNAAKRLEIDRTTIFRRLKRENLRIVMKVERVPTEHTS